MNNTVREKLCEIINDHGIDISKEIKQCHALLCDYCSNYKREIAALMNVANQQGLEMLISDHDKNPQHLINTIISKIYKNSAMSYQSIKWAVESWALALEVITDADLIANAEQLTQTKLMQSGIKELDNIPVHYLSKPEKKVVQDCCRKAYGYYSQQKYFEAAFLFRKSAEEGNANAQYNLAVMYANGIGVKQDETKAFLWYTKAACQGYANAQYNLGLMYEKGNGVTQDFMEAQNWYKKAAQQGIADAQYSLGIFYERGRGGEQDEVQAVYWYDKSAMQGNKAAQYNLGVMYATGRGIQQNFEIALYWYKKSAQSGFAYAQTKMGIMYEQGKGVAKNLFEAKNWYTLAAKQGNTIARKNLSNWKFWLV